MIHDYALLQTAIASLPRFTYLNVRSSAVLAIICFRLRPNMNQVFYYKGESYDYYTR